MARPPGALVVKWRDLAADSHSYAEIARRHPEYTPDQVRHYCLGNTGKKLPGPLQEPHRWGSHNVWLQGESSPHAELSREQVLSVLDDWDEESDAWGTSGAEWARRLGVSPSTIHMLRRGETWEHLNHPNQGRKRRPEHQNGDGPGLAAGRPAEARKNGAHGSLEDHGRNGRHAQGQIHRDDRGGSHDQNGRRSNGSR
jgi:hypothetical protein